jgi:hypothetical protein
LYVGPNFNESSLQAETVNLSTGAAQFTLLKYPGGSPADGTLPTNWTHCYNSTTGVLNIQMNMNFSQFTTDYNNSFEAYCQPNSMCAWNSGASACQCNITDTTNYLYKDCQANNSAICAWSVKEVDYPSTNGAYGFRFTLPSGFTASLPPKPNPQPALTGCFPSTASSPWNIAFLLPLGNLAGACTYTSSPPLPDFCTTPTTPLICPAAAPADEQQSMLVRVGH